MSVPRGEAGGPSEADAERDRLWCKALLPEGAEVINRVTARVLACRAAVPAPVGEQEDDAEEVDRALVFLEGWAVERFVGEGKFATQHKDWAWTVAQAYRALRDATRAPGAAEGRTEAAVEQAILSAVAGMSGFDFGRMTLAVQYAQEAA